MRDDQVFRFDHFVLDTNQMSLVRDGTPVDLRPKAFETLLALVRDAGRLVTKDALVQAVWPSVFVNDDALSQCIRDIRKALRDNDQSFIRTVPKRGYIFVQPVTTGIVDPKKVTLWRERSRAALAFGVAAMLIVLIVLVGERSQPGTQNAVGPSDSRLTLAVLPFSATDGSSADKILSQGFAEDILVALSRFADLEVIARGSSFRDVVTEADMTELGDLLKADLLLQGSMRRSGDSLRVSLQLIDPSTGTHRWAGQFNGAVSEFSALQDNMVEGIASQLVTNARDATLFRVQGQPPDRLEVYELVLRARGLWRRFTPEDTTEALQLTERALRMDPRYAVAWELLAQILLQLYIQPYDRSYADPVVLERAKKAAEEAVKLDPRYATAQATLGAILSRTGAYDESLRLLEAAVSLNSNDTTALTSQADILARAGEHELSLLVWEKVDRLDPFGPPLSHALKARSHVLLGQLSAALEEARVCVAKAPRFQPCLVNHIIATQAAGLHDEAQRAASDLLELNPDFSISKHFALVPYRLDMDRNALSSYLRAAEVPW